MKPQGLFFPLAYRVKDAWDGYLIPVDAVVDAFRRRGTSLKDEEMRILREGDESDISDAIEELAASSGLPEPNAVHFISRKTRRHFQGLPDLPEGFYVHWNYQIIEGNSGVPEFFRSLNQKVERNIYTTDWGLKFSPGAELSGYILALVALFIIVYCCL